MSTSRPFLSGLTSLVLLLGTGACTAPPLTFGRPCAADADCDPAHVCRAASDGTSICVGASAPGDAGHVDGGGDRDAAVTDDAGASGSDGGPSIDAGPDFDAGGDDDAGHSHDAGSGDDAGVSPSDAGPDGGRFDAGPLVGPVEVALSASHACALFDTGEVKCWGANDYGQLGLGDVDARGDQPGELGGALPTVDLGAGPGAHSIAVGLAHSCALLNDGTLKCWGRNQAGQLGLGDTEDRGDDPGEMGSALPTIDLGAGATIVAIAAGAHHTCALLTDGRVKCWGLATSGQLGLGDTDTRGDGPSEVGDDLPAVNLGAGGVVLQLVAGSLHNCALLAGGAVKCWGHNANGQLGLGDTDARGDTQTEMGDALAAVDLDGAAVDRLFAGGEHTCALLDDGALKCWGRNHVGQLGLGDTQNRGDGPAEMGAALPAVPLGAPASAVALGSSHACALLLSGQVKCWGQATQGQPGYGSTLSLGGQPGDVGPALPAVNLGTNRWARKISERMGGAFTCAILDDATVKCWGYNATGQLGLGDTENRGDDSNEMGDALPAVALEVAP